MFDFTRASLALFLAFPSATSTKLAKIPIIAITTSNSMSVNPLFVLFIYTHLPSSFVLSTYYMQAYHILCNNKHKIVDRQQYGTNNNTNADTKNNNQDWLE